MNCTSLEQIALGIPMRIHDRPVQEGVNKSFSFQGHKITFCKLNFLVDSIGKSMSKKFQMNYVKVMNSSYIHTSNAKFSGNLGGVLSPKKLLHNLSASRFVIIPQRLEDIGMAPALLKISN